LRNREWPTPGHAGLAEFALNCGEAVAEGLKADPLLFSKPRQTFVLGHRSPVDRSAQPYAVILPKNFDPNATEAYRLYVHLHGCNPWFTETAFIAWNTSQKHSRDGQTIEIQPYGRMNCGYEWAGETDVFEAIHDISRRYNIDPDRVVLGGFSMGGAGTWRIGLQNPTPFASLAPLGSYVRAGKIPRAKYSHPLKNDPPRAEAIRENLDRLKSVTALAGNAHGIPIMMGVGAEDKFLADHEEMKAALEKAGVKPRSYIVPGAGHKGGAIQTQDWQTFLVSHWRKPEPKEIRFATASLRHAERAWVRIEGMKRHYSLAAVHAIADPDVPSIEIKTDGVTRLSLRPGEKLIPRDKTLAVSIDGYELSVLGSPWKEMAFESAYGGRWKVAGYDFALRKRPGLQGPIDDAFARPFLCVRPTGQPWNPDVSRWAEQMIDGLEEYWQRHYRGDLPIRDDVAITKEDRKNYNLVLFGDGSSNRLIAEFLERLETKRKASPETLPFSWDKEKIVFGKKTFSSASHMPTLIYPGAFPSTNYVVINGAPNGAAIDGNPLPPLGDFAILEPPSQEESAEENKETGEEKKIKQVYGGFFEEDWGLPYWRPDKRRQPAGMRIENPTPQTQKVVSLSSREADTIVDSKSNQGI